MQERIRSLLPAMLALVPIGGLARVACLDPGIAKQRLIIGKVRKKPLGAARGISLVELVAGHRRSHARDLDIEGCLEAMGGTNRTRCFEHIELSTAQAASISPVWTFEQRGNQRLRRRTDLNSSCRWGENRRIGDL